MCSAGAVAVAPDPSLVSHLPTPAAVVDDAGFAANLAAMAVHWPGRSLRPHVKAHKTTALAARQAAIGHDTFTCATPREVVGMAAAGLGTDLLLANETLDPARLREMADARERHGASVTVAVDSSETLAAAVAAGIGHVLVDVFVGLPRCGCEPEAAGALADAARAAGLEVRGVMGYEGHLMMVAPAPEKARLVARSMERLHRAWADVGGAIVSAGGTGTYAAHVRAPEGGPVAVPAITELQAGSYPLLDSAYASLESPFRPAFWVVGTVISVHRGATAEQSWAVADVGLKALGMDHGLPTIEGAEVLFCSDEHVTFRPAPGDASALTAGDRVAVLPAHVDPTIALHDTLWLVAGDPGAPIGERRVLDRWAVDLRGW